MNAITQDDIEDIIAEAIDDSIDMDWTSKDAVRSIMRALEKEGLKVTSIDRELRALATANEATYVGFDFFARPSSATKPFFGAKIHNVSLVRSGHGPDMATAIMKAVAADAFKTEKVA